MPRSPACIDGYQYSMTLRTFSFGGGVQSTAALVLAAQGKIGYRVFLFANVGDDSENPATLRYVRDVAAPYALAHGIELHKLNRTRRDGTARTLYGKLTDDIPCPACKAAGDPACPRCHGTGWAESRSLCIPARMSNGAPYARSCTWDYKVEVIGKWLRQHGASPEDPATVGVGISLDEIERVNARKSRPYERLAYPLVGLGPEDTGLRLRRDDCARLIADAGLPVPPKSACWFCPFHRPEAWHDMRRNTPGLFAKACDLEDRLNERQDALGRDHVYLTRFGVPLRVAIPDGVDLLPMFDADEAHCDNGWCMT